MGSLSEAINNTNIEQNSTLTITNADLEPTTGKTNNDTDDKLNSGVLLVALSTTIKDMDAKLTTGWPIIIQMIRLMQVS